MLKGKVGFASRALTILLIGALGLLAFGCGGGGPAPGNTKDIYVKRFSVPNFSGILLDESVSWVFSHGVDASTLNHDSIRLRTGAQGGDAPRGTFVRGIFLIDSLTNTRVVVDPDQLSPTVIAQAEATGSVSLIDPGARYDLGVDSPFEGDRQVLFNHSLADIVTFVPEVPSRPDLSDTGYLPGVTYTVVLPAYPNLNVVRSVDGNPLLPRDGRVFVSTFTTVPLAASQLFLGGENEGNPRVVNTQPKSGYRVNVVQGEPGLSGGLLSESRIQVTTTRPLGDFFYPTPVEFEIVGVDRNGLDVTDTVIFSNQGGTRTTSELFARVTEVNLRDGTIPEAFRDTTNPSNDRDPATVTFRRQADNLLFLSVSATEDDPIAAPQTFPLGFNVQIEDPEQAPPAHITTINPGWAVPVVEPVLDNSGQPVLDGNGDPVMGVLGVDIRISIRFSQPLDPRTITTSNFSLRIASVEGKPPVEVSLFLRQTRLGVVEVVMTPLLETGLAPGQFYEVTAASTVRDLLGAPLDSVRTSFEVKAGGAPPTVGDIVESFDDPARSQEDVPETTANWNARKPFVGATEGALTAVFAPFAGSGGDPLVLEGGDEAFPDTGDVTQTIYNYDSIDIGIGAGAIADGNYALVIRSQGLVTISGLLDLSGSVGGTGTEGGTGDTTPTGGAPGVGGPGGFDGGAGAFYQGNFDGFDGAGPGGGIGGLSGNDEASSSTSDPARMRTGGGGAGHATDGTNAQYAQFKSQGSGLGGEAYGKPDFSDAVLVPAVVGVPTLVSGFGGSGGGGGGGEDDEDDTGTIGTAGGEDEGGGGGGGGGGALQIVTYTNIDVSGRIAANGGDGGETIDPDTESQGQGAPGGGGAGGSIWLQAFQDITLDSRAEIEALGGIGGLGGSLSNFIQKGGNGGDGYIRFEDENGRIAISDGSTDLPPTVTPVTDDSVGSFEPTLSLDSVGQSLFYNQFIPTPNYSAATVDMDLNGGTIDIFVQGAQEDLSQAGPQPVDPATDPLRTRTTDWLDISQVDQLDNFQYVRFRVEFSVDPDQDFEDPLPLIREIRIPVDTTPD